MHQGGSVHETPHCLCLQGGSMREKIAPLRAGGAKIAFLHPKSTFGVLVELSERHDH